MPLSNLFRRKTKTMKACGVYLRATTAHVISSSKTKNGLWISTGPIFKVERDNDFPRRLGEAIIAAFEASCWDIRDPEDLSSVGKDLLVLADFKTWSSFEKGASYFHLSLSEGEVTIEAAVSGKRGGFDFGGPSIKCSGELQDVGKTLLKLAESTSAATTAPSASEIPKLVEESPRLSSDDPFVSKLYDLGFFEGLTQTDAEKLQRTIEERGWVGIFDSHRLFNADAEDLAEGGIGDFIRELQPFLLTQGVKLPAIEDEISTDGYIVHVGDEATLIYDEAEEREASQMGVIWGLSVVRGFQIVDRLLAAAGSEERTYAVNGGNDLFAFILTPELHQTIMEHPDSSAHHGPYRPVEEYPWFGQPHE